MGQHHPQLPPSNHNTQLSQRSASGDCYPKGGSATLLPYGENTQSCPKSKLRGSETTPQGTTYLWAFVGPSVDDFR